jgi:hypothetical protein
MNLFVKKLLAKYVKYIEIIGYLFVLLFIAGLVALSQIKAEDEFVSLNGIFEIEKEIISFPKKQIILNVFAESSVKVKPGDNLIELTDNKKYISDHEIIKDLENQIKLAREVSDNNLVNKFSNILNEIQNRNYPNLDIEKIQSKLPGDYFPFVQKNEITEINQTIGGVFGFENGTIRVSEFPVDQQQKKKLKSGQTGTATLKLGFENSNSISVLMSEFSEREMIFELEDLSLENKQKIATSLAQNEDEYISVTLSVLVGSKSWMNLIWR